MGYVNGIYKIDPTCSIQSRTMAYRSARPLAEAGFLCMIMFLDISRSFLNELSIDPVYPAPVRRIITCARLKIVANQCVYGN